MGKASYYSCFLTYIGAKAEFGIDVKPNYEPFGLTAAEAKEVEENGYDLSELERITPHLTSKYKGTAFDKFEKNK
jgi:hypothetical protein